MIEKFIEFMKQEGLSENTYKSYASDIRIFEKYYFDSYGENLNKLVHTDISMYINYLFKHNISPKTINRRITALKEYNLFLISKKVQDDIVVKDRDYIKVQDTIINKKLPTQQEINKLKHFACKDEKNSKRDYCLYVY